MASDLVEQRKLEPKYLHCKQPFRVKMIHSWRIPDCLRNSEELLVQSEYFITREIPGLKKKNKVVEVVVVQ